MERRCRCSRRIVADMGEVLAILTAFFWAIALILFKRFSASRRPFTLNLFKKCTAFVLFTTTALGLGQTLIVSAPPKDLAIMLISGALGIGISDTLFFMALDRLGASRTALVDCLY